MTLNKEVQNETLEQGLEGLRETAEVKTISFEKFHDRSHFWGRLTIWAVIVLSLALPLYLSYGLGFHPGWSAILSGFLAYAAVVGVLWFVEPISYYPILGISGTYLAFLTGNIGNMCLPAASIAQSAVGVEPGTKKGELTATLAMAAASIVNIVMLLFIVLGGSYVVTLLPQSVVDSLVFVLPAIFGGLIAQLAMQKPLWGVIGIALALAVNLGPVPTSLKAFCCIFGLVIICLLLEKLKQTKEIA